MDKRAALIARQIEAEIIRREWPIGESLGSEQSLQQQYDVSRSVLREAIRLVEHHQVARMRRGPGGGLFVTVPDAAPATRAVVIYLEYLGTTIDELLAARRLLEPLASGLAADHIDEPGIDRLRAILSTDRPRPGVDDFHVVLGDLTGNPVLALFIDVLTRLTARYAAGSELPSAPEVDEAIRQMTVDHGAIVEAVTAGDSARAKTLTEQHLQTVTASLDRHYRPKRAQRERPAGGLAGKRAEVLASAVYQDIVAGGWQTGSVFGTETELLARYDVGRPVLREAVRLLEYHTVARMRRGPGGGLVVTEPQPQASVDTIALYLEFRRPIREDLRLVRDAIEIDNVAKVVGRREDADVAAFLAAQRRVKVGAGADDRDPGEAAGWAEFFFHTDLAELAGNRALNLFLRILVELFRRHWTSTMAPMPDAGDAEEVHHAHARIVDAILDGDDSMARHRSRKHLEALSSWWL
ncbi:FCD domain-containing protein [soil metagenome]